MYDFKKHIIYNHEEREVQEHYQRSWRRLLQESWLGKIRLQNLVNIKLGRFESRCRYFAGFKYNASFENLNLSMPFSQVKDKNTIYLRRRLY